MIDKSPAIVAIVSLATVATVGIALTRGVSSAQMPESRERVPVIVELFTSEGCSSCPPADEVLSRLVATQPVANAEIIALGEHVDYWDRLGWRDPFSSAVFTARQSEYDAKAFRTGNIYTPQLVVNGREAVVGSDYRAATSAIARAASALLNAGGKNGASSSNATAPASTLRLSVSAEHMPAKASLHVGTRIDVPDGLAKIGAADVVLAIVEDGLVSQVKRGENKGRELHHSAVVRSLTIAGSFGLDSRPWSADTTIRFPAEWNASRSRCIVFVQERATRRMIGAASASLSSAG
jgi:hypothetical protein